MVFVDSNIFISLWDKDNVNHQNALAKTRQLEKIGESIFISNIIVYEVASVLAMRVAKIKASQFLKTVEAGQFGVVFIDGELDREAKKIFEEIADKNISLFDCTSFALIEKYGVDRVFSFDKDFQKYGKSLGWEFI